MKIFCVGRNYVDHAKELGNAVPDNPIIFIKPPTAYLESGQAFHYPSFSTNVQYETEIVLKISKQGKEISEDEAKDFYSELTVGIDFTARDVQNELKEKRLPWELAKGFDNAALVGEFMPKPNDVYDINFKLLKNGELAQKGNTKDVIFSFEKLISFTSKYFTFEPDDLIFTGVPAGVGNMDKGDDLEGLIEDKKLFSCKVV